jgi:hypothetical protein
LSTGCDFVRAAKKLKDGEYITYSALASDGFQKFKLSVNEGD